MALVALLNADPDVDGILVQLPLPKHLDSDTVIQSTLPEKDVDGLHNCGLGTPTGCDHARRSWRVVF